MGGFGQDPIPGYDPPAPDTSSLPLTPETAVLRLITGSAAGRTFPLTALRILIGRSDAKAAIHADIDLSDCEQSTPPKVSRRHAELQWANAALRLIDLGSANGTWHNAERLAVPVGKPSSAPVCLSAGDRLRFADMEFEIVME